MPQPLSSFKFKGSINYGPGLVRARPELAVLIADVIARWGSIEGDLGAILAHILRADAEIGAEMFLALESPTAKLAALRAAGRAKFIGKELDVFDAILVIAWRCYGERNRLAHTTWGTHSDLPDALLTIPHRALVPTFAAWSSAADKHRLGQAIDTSKLMFDETLIMVWRKNDLEAVVKRCHEASGLLRLYLGWLMHAAPDIFQMLSNEPPVRAILDRQEKPTPSQSKADGQ